MAFFDDSKHHLIEVLHADGRSEWFSGWDDVDAMTGPDFTTERDHAVKYDLTHHREEVLADYERLCTLGFDASIETVGHAPFRRRYPESLFAGEPPALASAVIVRGATLHSIAAE